MLSIERKADNFPFLRSITQGVAALALVVATSLLGAPKPAFAADCGQGTKPAGDGSEASPWLVSTAENLLWVSWATSANNSGSNPTRFEALADDYLQAANIDMADLTGADAGCDWNPIGEGGAFAFSGSYDGAVYTVTGLQRPASLMDRVGMFGSISGGLVSRVHLRDVDFDGDDSIGGLAGELKGTNGRITESSVTGSVSGRLYVGGLVGHFLQGASIDNSYSRASVPVSNTQNLGTSFVGGLVGRVADSLDNDVVNAYSTGRVTPFDEDTENLGGLIGGNPTMTVTDSFWDLETSEQANSGGGTGKSTSDMRQIGTFSSWDIFDGWTAYDYDTPSDKWGICSLVNDGYPFLLNEYRENPCGSGDSGGSRSSVSGDSTVTSQPGVFLTVTGGPGDLVAGRDIFFGAYAVGQSSPYSLAIESGTPSVGQQLLASGLTNSGGHLEREVLLPGLPPGEHKIVFSGRGTKGELLTLRNLVLVDSQGRFVTVTPEVMQPVIR